LAVGFDRFEELMLRRFFYVNAFEIYGGVGGLYDYGPCGCAVFTNLLAYWRQHFVLHEDMLEISSVSMTPEAVLQYVITHITSYTTPSPAIMYCVNVM
jgi:glycyl-tRNA synthetase